MKRFNQGFLPFAAALSLVLVGAEFWLLQRARAEAERALSALEQKKQERDWLERRSPAPTAETEAAVNAALSAVLRRLDDLRDGLQAGPAGMAAQPGASKPTEAFFELAGMIERARAQAIAQRVTLRPEERFGFSAYAHEGPAAGLLGPVRRQQIAVQSLLEPLFESRPLALLGVRRTAGPQAGLPAARDAEDFFLLDSGLSLHRPGLIETEPVRLEFTGQTSTLRTFLTGLASLREPMIVRSVEVEPWIAASSSRPAGSEAPPPLVRQSLSKFAVTVEWVRLAGAAANPVP
jgi:hypothetical protein